MTEEILEHLGIHKSWWKVFIANSDELERIVDYLDNCNKRYYPEKSNIFRTFKVAVEDIKVVIVGQDPYPQGIATGLAFGIENGETPNSLDVIMTELVNYSGDIMIDMHFDRSLESWLKQGVLLLNSSLTVQAFKPGSHHDLWKNFMTNVFKFLNINTEKVVFVFMGKVAQYYKQYINTPIHYILETPHPRADSFSKTNKFVGSKVFEEIDSFVKQPIIWV